MNSQAAPTSVNGTQPGRLSIAILVISAYIFVATIVSEIVLWLMGVKSPWPCILISGIGIVYGVFKVAKGNPETKNLATAVFANLGAGALAGVFTTFAAISIRLGWELKSIANGLLIIALIDALLFGVPVGSIGGIILGSLYKHKHTAALTGGILAGIICSPVTILLSFVLLAK